MYIYFVYFYVEGVDEIIVLDIYNDNLLDNDNWYIDVIFIEMLFVGVILVVKELFLIGGDMFWISGIVVYEVFFVFFC